MVSNTGAAPQPREQLPIPLFDGVVLAVRSTDGRIYLGLRDLCQTLGLDLSSQRRRILADESLHLSPFRVLVERQFRTLDFLLLEDVPLWLLSVQQRRVAPAIRERFAYVKAYLVGAVQQAFAQLVALPEESSNAIEDLNDLDRIDLAFQQLAALVQRQGALETSQDRARHAFRDLLAQMRELRNRVQELEQHARSRISPEQRGTLYHMVQRWGTARAQTDTRQNPSVAIRKSWAS